MRLARGLPNEKQQQTSKQKQTKKQQQKTPN